MRVIILALDGLDPGLVERWQLRSLLQEHHGVHETVVDPYTGEVLTPVAWTSFITGLEPSEHGVRAWWQYGNPLIERLRWLPPLRWVRGKRRLLRLLARLGLPVPRPRLATVPPRVRTVFDEVPSRVLFWPAVNEPEEPHREYAEALWERGVSAFLEAAWRWHRWRASRLLEELRAWLGGGRERILAAWLDLADLVGHACAARCVHRLLAAYLELDRLAAAVRRAAAEHGEPVAILIASDHGIQPAPDGTGAHTRTGFWSLNVDPPLRPRRITDFKILIQRLLALNPR